VYVRVRNSETVVSASSPTWSVSRRSGGGAPSGSGGRGS
jgi:hypothetical protein